LALLVSAISTAIGWLLARVVIKYQNVDIVIFNGISMIIGGTMALMHSYIYENWQPLPVHNWKYFILLLIIIIINSNVICYNLHGYLIKKFTVTYISFANLIDPIFASFFGWLLLNEISNYNFWLSLIFVVIGLSLYYRESIKLQEL